VCFSQTPRPIYIGASTCLHRALTPLSSLTLTLITAREPAVSIGSVRVEHATTVIFASCRRVVP